MKVSDFLRQYQLTGAVPLAQNAQLAFWAGWLIGHAKHVGIEKTYDECREMAIKAAEFIESQVRNG